MTACMIRGVSKECETCLGKDLELCIYAMAHEFRSLRESAKNGV